MNGQTSLSKLVLEQGVDPNRQDWSGKTPLHYAVAKNRQLVELLLQYSPDSTIASEKGETPLTLARHLKKKAVIQLLGGS